MAEKIIAERYRLVHNLGRGSRANVYLSRAEDSGELFAIKVFGTKTTPTEVLSQFSRELKQVAQRWQEVDDPHVAQVYDMGWDERASAPFLVTEYIAGSTLAAVIKGFPELPVPVGLGIGCQVAAGLAAAHARELAHGNLQPHQVFVTPRGVVKLTDFGLACLADGIGWRPPELWPPDASLFYATVEQYIGRDTAGDAYALGALLYHLLIGNVPWPDYDLASLSQAVCSTGPALMTAARPGIPAEVDELVRQCMGHSLVEEVRQMMPAQAAEALSSLASVQPASAAEIADTLKSLWSARRQPGTQQPGLEGASLLIVQQNRRVALHQAKVLIGRRDPQKQIYPDIDLYDLDPDRVLHRQHAELCQEGSEWTIRACHRDGRLQVNDQTVDYGESRALRNGDKIGLSRLVDIIFELG